MLGGAIDEEINEYVKSISSEYENINIYQEITARYFNSKFMNKSDMLLLYWDMGSGKTIGSLLCAIRALEDSNYDRIIILSPKSIQEVFNANLKKLCHIMFRGAKYNIMYNRYKERMHMIPYNAWNANEQLQTLGNIDNSIFIIDEVHLFIKSVIKVNITPKDMKDKDKQNIGNAKRMYDKIRALKHKKILCLTGTPLAKFTFEMVPLFNLAHRDKDLFTENYATFQNKYYDDKSEKLKPGAEESILKKIDGKVSYVPPIDAGVKVSKLKQVLVEMSPNQFRQYVYDYCLELGENGYSNSINVFGVPFGSISSYHTKTFQDCLYWNDELDISDYEDIIDNTLRELKNMESSMNVGVGNVGVGNMLRNNMMNNVMNNVLRSNMMNNVSNNTLNNSSNNNLYNTSNNHTQQSIQNNDISGGKKDIFSEEPDEYVPPYELFKNDKSYSDMSEYFIDKLSMKGGADISDNKENDDADDENSPRHNIKKFHMDEKHCPKIIQMYKDSLEFDGIKCFYFRLTKTYGCDTMEKMLQSKGYELADPETALNEKGKRYVLFTGNVSQDRRNEFMKIINNKKNCDGEYIQYIIISPSGQVGISLHNVRFLGIGTTEFTFSTIRQIQTRCVRFRSHDDLPPEKRTLEQRIYFASPNKSYLQSNYKKLSVILSRTDPLIKDEKHPSIERIIFCNSIHDDIPMQSFRKLLYKASITEKIFKYDAQQYGSK